MYVMYFLCLGVLIDFILKSIHVILVSKSIKRYQNSFTSILASFTFLFTFLFSLPPTPHLTFSFCYSFSSSDFDKLWGLGKQIPKELFWQLLGGISPVTPSKRHWLEQSPTVPATSLSDADEPNWNLD